MLSLFISTLCVRLCVASVPESFWVLPAELWSGLQPAERGSAAESSGTDAVTCRCKWHNLHFNMSPFFLAADTWRLTCKHMYSMFPPHIWRSNMRWGTGDNTSGSFTNHSELNKRRGSSTCFTGARNQKLHLKTCQDVRTSAYKHVCNIIKTVTDKHSARPPCQPVFNICYSCSVCLWLRQVWVSSARAQTVIKKYSADVVSATEAALRRLLAWKQTRPLQEVGRDGTDKTAAVWYQLTDTWWSWCWCKCVWYLLISLLT